MAEKNGRHAQAQPSRFDRLVWLSLGILACLTGLLAWYANQPGAPVATAGAGQPRCLYIAYDEQERLQLFVSALGQASQFTQASFGVWDYAVSTDGKMIAYSATRQDGNNDLWLVGADGGDQRQLLDCAGADCSEVAWQPGDQRLVYTRREASSLPRLWWLDLASGETLPVFQDDQAVGMGARWSPDGHWLSYVSPPDSGVRVYNVDDGSNFLIPSQAGTPAVWSPLGDALLLSELQVQGEQFFIHLLHVDVTSKRSTDLSGETDVDDGTPTWSPDGKWIVFGRRSPSAAWDRQLWLMEVENHEARPLTDDREAYHGAPAWSPDGGYVLFQRCSVADPRAQPGIWLLEVETGALREVAAVGSQPAWIP